MINWTYNPNNVAGSFTVIPEGDHTVKIAKVEEAESKSGYQMYQVTLAVKGFSSILRHFIVFMPDKEDLTNRSLKEFADCFGLPVGDLDTDKWTGRIGRVKVEHRPGMDGSKTFARVTQLYPVSQPQPLRAEQPVLDEFTI